MDRTETSKFLDLIIKELKKKANQKNVEGMARFGINSENTLGVPVYVLREMAKSYRNNHELAQLLWKSKIHEARLLAGFIDDSNKVTQKQMEDWVVDFNSWDVCDQVVSNLFDKTPWAYEKAFEWSKRDEEFVKRAGFVMIAALAVHDKSANNEKLIKFFPIIKREAKDERNFVRKAVNWALRQIGKRNHELNLRAIQLAEEILEIDSKSAKWIARDALRELKGKFIEK